MEEDHTNNNANTSGTDFSSTTTIVAQHPEFRGCENHIVELLLHLYTLYDGSSDKEEQYSLQRLGIALKQGAAAFVEPSPTEEILPPAAFRKRMHRSKWIELAWKTQAIKELRYACESGNLSLVQFLVETVGLEIAFECYDSNENSSNDKVKHLPPIAQSWNKVIVDYLSSRTIKHAYPNSWYCPSTQELMVDPSSVDAPCMHTFEKSSLEKWIHQMGMQRCPLCRQDLRSTSISTNRALLEGIQRFGPHANQHTTPLTTENLNVLLRQLEDYKECRNIVGILHIMSSYLDPKCGGFFSNARLQGAACFALSHFDGGFLSNAHQGAACFAPSHFDDSSATKQIADAGGIQTILAVMKVHKSDLYVQSFGCYCFYALCRHNDNVLQLVAELGGIQTIVAAMKMFPQEIRVQMAGCGALKMFSSDHSHSALVVAADAIPPILYAMKTHNSVALLQKFGFQNLEMLCYHNDESRDMIGLGGIQIVVAGMKAHESCAYTQRAGCLALGDLACSGYGVHENQALIAGAGGIRPIIVAMEKHLHDSEVQQAGCIVLAKLASNVENKVLITDAGGIPALVKALENHPSVEYVQAYGCRALGRLAESAKNKASIAELGGIPAIVSAMKAHNEIDVKRLGCSANLVLATDKPSNQTLIAQSGGVEVIEAALTLFVDQFDIVNCQALLDLCRGSNDVDELDPETQPQKRMKTQE